jgi:DNA topoisomerase-1
MDDVTLEDALDMFKLPREVGQFEGETLTVAVGKFGPYVRHGKMFVSLGKEDPLTITGERATELVIAKREELKKMMINEFQDGDEVVQVKNGRYGPYISVGKKNYRIPKGTEPESLTLADCKVLIEKDKDRPRRGRGPKAKAKKK